MNGYVEVVALPPKPQSTLKIETHETPEWGQNADNSNAHGYHYSENSLLALLGLFQGGKRAAALQM
jgi:hypothetical protein